MEAVILRNEAENSSVIPNRYNIAFRQFRIVMARALFAVQWLERPMRHGVGVVFFWRAPIDVLNSIVGLITVAVTCIKAAIWRRADELLGYKPVNVLPHHTFASHRNGNPPISSGVALRLKFPLVKPIFYSDQTLNAAIVGDKVIWR